MTEVVVEFGGRTQSLGALREAAYRLIGQASCQAIRQAEVGAARTMIERVKDRHNLWPERLAADTAYGSAPIRRLLQHNRRKTDLHSAEVLRTRITSWRAMLEGCIVPAAPSLTETSLPLTNGGPRRTRLLSTATLVPTAQ